MTWDELKSKILFYYDSVKFGLKYKQFVLDHREWSDATFGTPSERNCLGPLKHLKKEVDEIISDPTDLYEFSDALLLLVDNTRRAGFTQDQLIDAAIKKLEINKTRKWTKPVNGEPCEHAKD